MENKLKSLAIVIVIALTFTSCISTNKGFQSSPVIARNVELDPIKADIVVNETEKLKGESTSAYFLIFRVAGDNTFADGIHYSTNAGGPINLVKANRLNSVRGAAAYNALRDKNFDVLVHPTYAVTVQGGFIYKKYNVVVEGYGATYKNFRTEKQKVIITDNNNEYIFPDNK
jgi:hypothetical protein